MASLKVSLMVSRNVSSQPEESPELYEVASVVDRFLAS